MRTYICSTWFWFDIFFFFFIHLNKFEWIQIDFQFYLFVLFFFLFFLMSFSVSLKQTVKFCSMKSKFFPSFLLSFSLLFWDIFHGKNKEQSFLTLLVESWRSRNISILFWKKKVRWNILRKNYSRGKYHSYIVKVWELLLI